MLSKPAIELGNLRRRERQLRAARSIVQARPKCHGELGSVAWRELQEFGESARRHAFILPFGFAWSKLLVRHARSAAVPDAARGRRTSLAR